MNRFLNNLAEGLASTWKLLSDTSNFLSRAKLLERYEGELTEMRNQLYRYRKNPETVRRVREQVVALRRALRLEGHDLRLGSKDLVLEGFRHDDAMGEGFRRLVLGIAAEDIVALAGDLNHIELAEMLESPPARPETPAAGSLAAALPVVPLAQPGAGALGGRFGNSPGLRGAESLLRR